MSVIVIGGGPAGLGTAGALARVGVAALVLDQGQRVGDRWRQHYDRLHLHTTRSLSGLPGLGIPRAYGRWVKRDHLADYLEQYARHHRLQVEHGVCVERIERTDGRAFRVLAGDGAERTARTVVIATGFNRVPFFPSLRGNFSGDTRHASEYRNAAPYLGKRVLVVGSGNSGAEIAQDLAEHGVDVSIAIRTPPTILRRDTLGVPSQWLSIALAWLPPRAFDAIAATVTRITMGDLERYGLPRASVGVLQHFLEASVTPILDVGFARMLRQGRIRVVGTVQALEGDAVRVAEPSANGPIQSPGRERGAQRLPVDAIIWATGYRRGLEPLVGHLGVLDSRGQPLVHGAQNLPAAPGLYFVGFTNSITGALLAIRREATSVARAIARQP